MPRIPPAGSKHGIGRRHGRNSCSFVLGIRFRGPEGAMPRPAQSVDEGSDRQSSEDPVAASLRTASAGADRPCRHRRAVRRLQPHIAGPCQPRARYPVADHEPRCRLRACRNQSARGVKRNPRPRMPRFLPRDEIRRFHEALDACVAERPSSGPRGHRPSASADGLPERRIPKPAMAGRGRERPRVERQQDRVSEPGREGADRAAAPAGERGCPSVRAGQEPALSRAFPLELLVHGEGAGGVGGREVARFAAFPCLPGCHEGHPTARDLEATAERV